MDNTIKVCGQIIALPAQASTGHAAATSFIKLVSVCVLTIVGCAVAVILAVH